MSPERQTPYDFPAELERHIFELAFYNQRGSSTDLLLVCKHVREWIEKLVYREILFNGMCHDIYDGMFYEYDEENPSEIVNERYGSILGQGKEFSKLQLMRTMDMKPTLFFQKNVRALHFRPANENQLGVLHHQLPRIFAKCSEITSFMFTYFVKDTHVTRLPLTRIRIPDVYLAYLNSSVIDSQSPLRRTLTHFHNDVERLSIPRIADLENFASLTHVTVCVVSNGDTIDSDDVKSQLRVLLSLTRLKVVVVFSDYEKINEYAELFAFDERVVVLQYMDLEVEWAIKLAGYMDFWEYAELVIAARQ